MAKCALEGCNKKARRRFCSNKHKDRYHNIHNPRGKFAHLNGSGMNNDNEFDNMDPYEDDHPFSSEGLGQWL